MAAEQRAAAAARAANVDGSAANVVGQRPPQAAPPRVAMYDWPASNGNFLKWLHMAYNHCCFAWMVPLLTKANRTLAPGDVALVETDADDIIPDRFCTNKAPSLELRDFPSWRSVFWDILVMFRGKLILHVMLALTVSTGRLVSPLVLRDFLLWLGTQGTDHAESLGRGFGLAVALGACAFLVGSIQHQQQWYGTLIGFLMRQTMIATLHKKLMRLSSSAISPGKVINLCANDVRRFEDTSLYWIWSWIGPLELALVVVMISLELDFVSAIAGASAIIALIPLQVALTRPVTNIRRDTAVATDARVRLTGEAINGVLACKMLSWERPLSTEMIRLRQVEAGNIGRMMRVRATTYSVQFVLTSIVTFIVFAVYRYRTGVLSVSAVFYVLSLLQLPKSTMGGFLFALQALTELRVSIQRFHHFLTCPEPPAASADSHHLPRGTILLGGAVFDWSQPLGPGSGFLDSGPAAGPGATGHITQAGDKSAKGGGKQGGAKGQAERDAADAAAKPFTLSGVRLHVRPGELLGVAGEVGSGKSTLLAALLGELQPAVTAPPPGAAAAKKAAGAVAEARLETSHSVSSVNHRQSGASGEEEEEGADEAKAGKGAELPSLDSAGGTTLVGSLAFCPQVPWIVAGSFRENVVFGKPYDEDKYQRVLRACALLPDVAILPKGDATELGERGINLSGGQKARLALARAAYSQADVMLLDDPLSAVDARVGRTLFHECIGPEGLMKGRTRVLVTHQQQSLPLCDRVLVLRDGKPVALGPYADLKHLNLPELASAEAPVLDDATADSVHPALPPGPPSGSSSTTGDIAPAAAKGPGGQGDDEEEDARVVEGEVDDYFPAGEEELEARRQEEAAGQLPGSSGALTHSHSINMALPPAAAAAAAGQQSASQLEPSGSGSWSRTRSLLAGPGALGALLSLRRSPSGGGLTDEQKRAAVVAHNRQGKLVVAEGKVEGTVAWSAYWLYFKRMGLVAQVTLPIFVLSAQAAYMACDWWLSLWARASPADQADTTWEWVYGLLAGLVVFLGFVRAIVWYFG